MAKKKYQKKKENLDARLASEGLTREAGRIVPVSKEKTTSESPSSNESTQDKKVVVPPSVKKAQAKPAVNAKVKPKSKTSNTSSRTSYGWFQKVVVFGVLFGLIGVGFVSLAGSEPTPEVIPTPTPSESIISEQTITVPPAGTTSEVTTPEEPSAESTPAN